MPPREAEVDDVTLAVLAGGEAKRMGFAKGELRLGDRPILVHLLERFAWPGSTLVVTAPGREHPPGWERFTREVADPAGGQGPLRGVLTALENARTSVVVVTAVDMPLVEAKHLRWVARELYGRPGVVGLMLRQRTGRTDRVQPFPSAFRVEAVPAIRQMLVANRRSLHGLLDNGSFVAVDAPAEWGARVWTNLNFPADLDAPGR